jgi:uncharacterized protein (TIGR02600 family)
MNLPSLLRSSTFRRRGMALVIVIGALALATMLLLAMFSLTETEYRSTQSYVAGLSAKHFGDITTEIVKSQLIRGSLNTDSQGNSINTAGTRPIHATQPGMIRKYKSDGTFLEAFRLYSSSQMRVPGPTETAVFTQGNSTPAEWDQMPAKYVDLNEPVVRPALGAGSTSGAGVALFFPILDPRAAYNYLGTHYTPDNPPPPAVPTTQVEGFWYDRSTSGAGSGGAVTYNGVRNPLSVGGSPELLRCPMPVEWIYFLQDGTMGTLSPANKFISSGGTGPDANNPIVARIAFWTDDESCKININTASEPTFMAAPYYYHQRDFKWANFPAASGEYQRYPGHPATVALSTVLAPNWRLDPYRPQDDGFQQTDTTGIVAIKEYIYNLAPKVSTGGSLSGTVPFVLDDFSMFNGEATTGASQAVNQAVARAERLYASVDEMLFADGLYNSGTGRVEAKYNFPASARTMFDHDTLERSRFFLTAHSRSPEFTMYGLPRVCMWPVADGELADNIKRTNFDNLIALCATIRGATSGTSVDRSYFFRRSQAHHSTYDVTGTTAGFPPSTGLARNSRLLDYLVSQMTSLNWPQTSTSGVNAANYVGKYGVDNVRQLAVQFFDYIRCTNLYDGILARDQDGTGGTSPGGQTAQAQAYYKRDSLATQLRTFTEQRVTPAAKDYGGDPRTRLIRDASDDAGVLPGHGQVTPAVWDKAGTRYMGFGRMFTLSEVGLHVICTADGQNDQYACDFMNENGVRIKSGGGSAARSDPQLDSQETNYQPRFQPNSTSYPNSTEAPPVNAPLPYNGRSVWWSNFPPLSLGSSPGAFGARYGTNSKKKFEMGLLGSDGQPANKYHPSRHPGFAPENWNLTLAEDTPLEENERRIQAVFLMESFCPMLGWTKFHPEYTIMVDGDWIGQIKINGERPFDTTGPVIVKSNGNLYEANNVHSMGGHAGPSAMAGGRGGRPVSGQGKVVMGSDPSWLSGNTNGHNALTNYGLTSNFLTVRRDQTMRLQFPNGELRINIYDKHDWQTLQPIQKIAIRFPSGEASLPVPTLVYNNYPLGTDSKGGVAGRELNYWTEVDKFGNIKYRRATQAPHWWVYNQAGCIGRMTGRVNPAYVDNMSGGPFWLSEPAPIPPGASPSPLRQMLRGRLDTVAAANDGNAGWTPPGTAQGIAILPPESSGFESDVVRTMVPALGDYRMVAARYDVRPELWRPHPDWENGPNTEKAIHTFSTFWGDFEAGFNLPPALDRRLLVALVNFGPTGNTTNFSRTPDLPPSNDYAQAANSYGDFDAGIANAREGPYVNKPDEGNFYAGEYTRAGNKRFYRSGYFFESWHNSDDWRSGVYMTPNRLISSPVMFGSLPTGIWATGGAQSLSALTGTPYQNMPCRPWQTLLFRPYVRSNQAAYGSKPIHPGDGGPKDHFLLDMFFMPVVEPYAISEPLSVAGRINMNYQIVPFTNIRRATGMYGVMKGEFITAIPNGDIYNSKNFRASPNTAQQWDTYHDEKTSPRKFWHRKIQIPETLAQFDDRFNMTAGGTANGLFRSASQICEMHLVPDVSTGITEQGGEFLPTMIGMKTANARNLAMTTFWQNHAATGDNVRERPYSNLYARLTTRSNTFRIHVRAQVVKKARSTDPLVFDPLRDQVLSEYRGSTLLERFVDPSDNARPLPDYAASATPVSLDPLDSFYQFRVIESKRFNP